MFNNKWFSLTEMVVVMAIISMLWFAAITTFNWAQADTRDTRRIADLNSMTLALDSYYMKYNRYPQPAKQSKTNLWWYKWQVGWIKPAKPTCSVMSKKDEDWNISNEIDYDMSKYDCWWDITIKKTKIIQINCSYTFYDNWGWNLYPGSEFSVSIDNLQEWRDHVKLLANTYTWDHLDTICDEFFSYQSDQYSKLEDVINFWNQDLLDMLPDNIHSITKPLTNINVSEYIGVGSVTQVDTMDLKNIIVWWKWTLTEKSWSNSIHKENPEMPFYWFINDQSYDPKYDKKKYKNYWLGYYIYSVFLDNVWTWNHVSKASVWATQYELAATLEKEENKEINPETLIVWNYKRPKNNSAYPISLIWSWWRDVIVNGQQRWEKARDVDNPDMNNNLWVPYAIEALISQYIPPLDIEDNVHSASRSEIRQKILDARRASQINSNAIQNNRNNAINSINNNTSNNSTTTNRSSRNNSASRNTTSRNRVDITNNINIDVPYENEAFIKSILRSFPASYFNSLKKVKAKPDSRRRWLASSKSVYLNFDRMDTEEEVRRVFIHELWHIFDLGHLTSNGNGQRSGFKDWSQDIYTDDKSVLFYSLCWESEYVQNWNCSESDFVSWYASADPFEDFAESFLLYFENNESFRIMANESEVIKAKYNLLTEFLNIVPDTWTYEWQVAMERTWDLTLMR